MYSFKNFLLSTLLFILCINTLDAQEIQNGYQLIRVDLSATPITELAALGLEVDHGMMAPGRYWMNYLSKDEINLLNSNQIKFTIPDKEELASLNSREDKCPKQNFESYPDPKNFRLGAMGGYYTPEEMNAILDSMHLLYPNLISERKDISDYKTFEGRSIQWLRISNNPDTDQNKPRILYTSLHHSREPMGLTQLIYFMWHMLEDYSTNPEIKELIDNSEMYFVPCVNPDGYAYNYTLKPTGGGMWRKNRHIDASASSQGVDLNRNYGLSWGWDDSGSSPIGTMDTYRGKSAFSEPETQAIAYLVDKYPFSLALNYHTFGNYLIHPWSYIDDPCPDDTSFKNIGTTYAQQNKFAIGTSQETVGYKTNGGSDDWIYGHDPEHKVFSMTPEVGLQEDGFWPARSKITDLAKTTLTGNIIWSKMAHRYYDCAILNPLILTKSGTNTIDLLFNRIGVQEGPVQLKMKVLSSNAELNKTSISLALANNAKKLDDFIITLHSNANIGDEVTIELKKEMGSINEFDTLTFVVQGNIEGTTDHCDELTTATTEGTWGIDSEIYYSAPSSFSDSPGNNYADESNTSLIFNKEFQIPAEGISFLSFWSQWDIEANYDYAQVFAITDEGNIPLCGQYTKTGNSLQDDGQPVYDGNMTQWVKEQISLLEFAGMNIKIGFRLVSDQLETRDGFFVDDVTVSTFSETLKAGHFDDHYDIQIYPCPASTFINIETRAKNDSGTLNIFNIFGRLVQSQNTSSVHNSTMDVSGLEPGIYLLELVRANGQKLTKKWVKI